ncbi:SDR family NAD(P)-dependent oxidoreductase [Pseudochelatococcus sp. B33]
MSNNRRIALITGGASGLGLATATKLAEQGISVAIADLDGDKAGAAAHSLPGGPHMGLAMDVSNEAAVEAGFTAAETELGPIAVFANFAGVLRMGNGTGALTELELDEWEKIYAVNARGSFLGVREMARRRTKTPVEHGRIILVSSSNAQMGGYQGTAAYCSSKGAVLSLMKIAARELAPLGITVNAIAPGAIDTPMLRSATRERTDADVAYSGIERIPLRRVGRPEEIAAAAAFLASIDGGYVTGSTIDVNGGIRMQ